MTFHIHVITIPTVLLECQDVWCSEVGAIVFLRLGDCIFDRHNIQHTHASAEQVAALLHAASVSGSTVLWVGSTLLITTRGCHKKKSTSSLSLQYHGFQDFFVQVPTLVFPSKVKLGSKNPLSVLHRGVDRQCTLTAYDANPVQISLRLLCNFKELTNLAREPLDGRHKQYRRSHSAPTKVQSM